MTIENGGHGKFTKEQKRTYKKKNIRILRKIRYLIFKAYFYIVLLFKMLAYNN